MAKRTLRPMEFGELLDEVFDIYKQRFMLLVGISAVGSILGVPSYILKDNSAMVNPFTLIGSVDMLYIIAIVLLYRAALIWAISACYLEKAPSILSSFRAILPKALPVVVIGVISYLLIMAGSMFLIVPGIFLDKLTHTY